MTVHAGRVDWVFVSANAPVPVIATFGDFPAAAEQHLGAISRWVRSERFYATRRLALGLVLVEPTDTREASTLASVVCRRRATGSKRSGSLRPVCRHRDACRASSFHHNLAGLKACTTSDFAGHKGHQGSVPKFTVVSLVSFVVGRRLERAPWPAPRAPEAALRATGGPPRCRRRRLPRPRRRAHPSR